MKRIWNWIGKIWQDPQSKPFSRCYVKAQTFARCTEGSLANLKKQNLCERSVLPQLWVHFLIIEIKDKVKCLSWSLGLTFGLLVKYTELDRFFFFFKRCEIFQMGTKRSSFVVTLSYREEGGKVTFFWPMCLPRTHARMLLLMLGTQNPILKATAGLYWCESEEIFWFCKAIAPTSSKYFVEIFLIT